MSPDAMGTEFGEFMADVCPQLMSEGFLYIVNIERGIPSPMTPSIPLPRF